MCILCVRHEKTAFTGHKAAAAGMHSASSYEYAAFFNPSGVTEIDSLASLSWADNAFTPVSLTVSFDSPKSGHWMMNAPQQASVREALERWSDVANLTFTEVSGAADITFSQGSLSDIGAIGVAYYNVEGTRISDAEVVMDPDEAGGFVPGQLGFMVLLHEIGHALGLKHPFDDTPNLDEDYDNHDYTVMSYTGDGDAGTPMLMDIRAIQYLYGGNTSYNSGDTQITLQADQYGNPDKFTLWDGGGTDTLDGRGHYADMTLDLGEGPDYRSTVADDFYFFIAYGSNIERAIGGYGNDTIYGNGLANWLYGYSGADTISGLAGADTIVGGRDFSDDTDSADTIYGNAGNDIIYGNAGDDALYGGSGLNDASETGNDILYGGFGHDRLYGNGGNDTLVGGYGNDSLYGGAGSDVFVMGWSGGNDLIYPFQVGSDMLRVPYNVNNSGLISAAGVFANSVSDTSHTYVNLGGGHGALLLFTNGAFSAADIEII